MQENWFLMAIATAFAILLGSIGFSCFIKFRNLPQHIQTYPNGCCAKSCCGKRIIRNQKKEIEENSNRKKTFLKRVDSVKIKKRNTRTSEDQKTKSDTEEEDELKKIDMSDSNPKKSCLKKICCCCCCCTCCSGFWNNRSQRIKVGSKN